MRQDDSLRFPDDLIRAQTLSDKGLCCSTILATDVGPGEPGIDPAQANAVGCVGIILAVDDRDSVCAVHPSDCGTYRDTDGNLQYDESSVVTQKSELRVASRPASLEHNRKTSFDTNRRVAATKKHTPFAPDKNAAETQVASHGLASFYTEGTQTANGERFDTHELTAAHRTLPFGTRLRVTNVATGRSVTVRVNDRGPYVAGRVVDVSYAAAETLGMVGGGVAKVKLDVVH